MRHDITKTTTRLLLLALVGACLLLTAATLLTACAHVSKNGRTFIGWGKAEFNADGTIKSIESKTPLDLGRLQIGDD